MVGLVLGTIGKEIGSSFARNFAMASVKEGAKNVVKSTGFKVGAGVAGAGAVGFGTYKGIKHFKNKKKTASEETDQFIEGKQEEVKPATEINAVVVPEEDHMNFEKLNAKIEELEKNNDSYKQSIDTLTKKFDELIAQLTPSEEPKAEAVTSAPVDPQPQTIQQPQAYIPNPVFQMGIAPQSQMMQQPQVFNQQPAVNPAPQAEALKQEETIVLTETNAPAETVVEVDEDTKITAADIAKGEVSKKIERARAAKAKSHKK